MRWLRTGSALIVGALALLTGLVAAILAIGFGATFVIASQVEAAYPAKGRFVPVNGGRLAILEDGPSTEPRATIILLHGASANAADPMEGIGRELARRGYRVIAFDRPGYGWSDRLDRPDAGSLATQATAIAEGMDSLGIERAIVFGHSWSGALALRLALDHPKRVSGLVLAAPVAMPFPKRRLPLWARWFTQPWFATLMSHTLAVPVGRYYLETAAGNAFSPQPMAPGYVERSRAALILRPGPALANLQDLLALPPALDAQVERYGEIGVPTAVVAGDADPAVRVQAQAVPLAERIPGAALTRLPGIGHMLHYVATDALAEAVDAVEKRVSAAR